MTTEPGKYAHSNRTSPSPSPTSRMAIISVLNPSNAGSTESLPESTVSHNRAQVYAHRPHSHQQQPPYHLYTTPQYYGHIEPPSFDGHVDASPAHRGGPSNSSTSLYGGRDRFPSASSSSSATADKQSPIRRAPRPKYEEEEMYFIWYHRVDLRQEWRQVRESFNSQFPDRQRSGFQGIQCKFYRFIREKQCPTLRDQKQHENQRGNGGGSDSRSSPGDQGPAYGVVNWTGVWFPWMNEPPPAPRR